MHLARGASVYRPGVPAGYEPHQDTWACLTCGVLVSAEYVALHTRWHEGMAEPIPQRRFPVPPVHDDTA